MDKNQMEITEPIHPITEINLLDELSNKVDIAENGISELEDRSIELIQSELQRK